MLERTFLVLLGWSLPGLAKAGWTVANSLRQALWHRRQYRESVGNYPRERASKRAALFPGCL